MVGGRNVDAKVILSMNVSEKQELAMVIDRSFKSEFLLRVLAATVHRVGPAFGT